MNLRLNVTKQERFLEIDVLRGISVLAMVIYHGAWNLWYFDLVSLDMTSEVSRNVAKVIGTSFLIIMGVCLYLSYTRATSMGRKSPWQKYLTRGVKTLGWAALISAVTHLIMDGGVVFGILHLISISIMVSPLFLPRPTISGVVGLIIAVVGWNASNWPVSSIWLLPLGIGAPTLYMVDYYPLVPWLGMVLFGIGLGHFIYPKGKRSSNQFLERFFSRFTILAQVGQRALPIYLVHQPLLFALTYLVARIR